MKRIIILIICIVTLCVTTTTVVAAKCLLVHKGYCKIYEADAIQRAINNAVDGDTIFLEEGYYPGFNVTKKITVRGTGWNTHINDLVQISIPGNPWLTQTVLEGLHISADVSLSAAMNRVEIKKCRMKELITWYDNNYIVIRQCEIIDDIQYGDHIKQMSVENSWVKIGNTIIVPKTCPVYFTNCYIYASYVDKCRGTFRNCYIYGANCKASSYYSYCNMYYSLLSGRYSSLMPTTCRSENVYYNDDTSRFSVEDLENLGYLGDDGTVVGEYGGSNPYSLTMGVPIVSENSISIDEEKKNINITLKVIAE